MPEQAISVAFFGDMHVGKENSPDFYTLAELRAMTLGLVKVARAKISVIVGDSINQGNSHAIENAMYILSPLYTTISTLMVTGNHDYDRKNDSDDALVTSARGKGIQVLENDAAVVHVNGRDIGFVGLNGYLGKDEEARIKALPSGTERRAAYYEGTEQRYYQKFEENVQEMDKKGIPFFVVMHYSPVAETMGEPPPTSPIDFSPKFIDPIAASKNVIALVHGHYHGSGANAKGYPLGHIMKNDGVEIPVHNVALPMLKRRGMNPLIMKI